MAQLDILSYFTQLFWLTLVLGFFYVTIVRRILPGITKIYKVRTLTVNLDNLIKESKVNKITDETKLIINSLETANRNLREVCKLNANLMTENIKTKNRKGLGESNKVYINSITKLLLENSSIKNKE